MQKPVNFGQVEWKRANNLEVQLSSGQNDMLSRLLLESFDTRVCLAQKLQPLHKLRHIRRDRWFQSDSDDWIHL